MDSRPRNPLDKGQWRKAIWQAAVGLWSAVWRGAGWAAYLTFLAELQCFSHPPFLDALPLFRSILVILVLVFWMSLVFGGWPALLGQDVSQD